MNKNLEFWKEADCEDCPVRHSNNEMRNNDFCPFDNTFHKPSYNMKVIDISTRKPDGLALWMNGIKRI
jgi:hypothetical protein